MLRTSIEQLMVSAALACMFMTLGCAPPFPKQMLDKVSRNMSFKELQSAPEKYKGTWVMFGGVIASARNAKEGTLIEVLQKPVGGSGRPLQTDVTEGRFLLLADQFLDTAVYHAGREITVIGEVAGLRVQPLGEIEYRYPLVTGKSIHLWDPSSGPRFVFGIGIGVSSHH